MFCLWGINYVHLCVFPKGITNYELYSQLQAEIPLQLNLAILSGKTLILSIPSTLIKEWQTVASH